jgi:hypothetical protein
VSEEEATAVAEALAAAAVAERGSAAPLLRALEGVLVCVCVCVCVCLCVCVCVKEIESSTVHQQ